MTQNTCECKMDVHPKYPRWLPAIFRNGWLLSRKVNELYSSVLDEATITQLDSVSGHTTRRQCATLFYFAYTQTEPGRIVEIGSFKGQSTAWMATALKLSGQQDKIAAVDPHINTRDTEEVPAYQEESSYDAFINNMTRMGVSELVEPIKATSSDAVKNWDEQIRLLFVDGSHRYEDVLLDLQLWVPLVRNGGIICMHDTKASGPFPGVRRAMQEYLVSNNNFKELVQLLNFTTFIKR